MGDISVRNSTYCNKCSKVCSSVTLMHLAKAAEWLPTAYRQHSEV